MKLKNRQQLLYGNRNRKMVIEKSGMRNEGYVLE